MARTFSLDEVRGLLPAIRARAADLIRVRADLAAMVHAHNAGEPTPVADIKALEARMGELLDGFSALGAQVKGYAPLLLDFPMELADRTVLLCWLEGDEAIAWFHEEAHGFMGRRPLSELPLGADHSSASAS